MQAVQVSWAPAPPAVLKKPAAQASILESALVVQVTVAVVALLLMAVQALQVSAVAAVL